VLVSVLVLLLVLVLVLAVLLHSVGCLVCLEIEEGRRHEVTTYLPISFLPSRFLSTLPTYIPYLTPILPFSLFHSSLFIHHGR
jgi:hypothetical protein